MEGGTRVTRSMIDEFHSLAIRQDQMEGESGVSRSIIDEVHSSDMVKRKVKVVFLDVSSMNFILCISK